MKMAVEQFIQKCFLCAISIVVVGGVTVSWENFTPIVYNEGETFSLNCTLRDLGPNGAISVARIVKKGEEPSTGRIVSDNSVVQEEFDRLGRIGADYHYDQQTNVATVNFTITGLKAIDSGSYHCFSLQSPSVYDTVEVEVKALLKTVTIYYLENDTYVEAPGLVQLIHNRTTGIRCQAVTNGTVHANLTVTVGDKDESSNFNASERLRDFDIGYEAVSTLEYVTTTPAYHYNGKTLRCNGTVHGLNTMEASVDLDVVYPPRIRCERTKHHAQLNDRVTMGCQVFGNPIPKKLWWRYGKTGTEKEILSPSRVDELTADDEVVSSDSINATLTIRKVSQAYFQKYVLYAESRIGTEMLELTLTKGDPNNGPENNAILTVVPSLFSLLMTVMAATAMSV